MSVQISYKKQTIFGILVLIIILLTIEGLSQIYDYEKSKTCQFMKSDASREISYDLQIKICNDNNHILKYAGIDMSYPPNQHYNTININNFGFRGSDIVLDNAPEMFRIFVVGGSTTFGTGTTSDHTTIPGFLQEKFDKEKIEVINAGISSATSKEETRKIKNELLKFNPDMIIIYDGYNDIHFSYEHHLAHNVFDTKKFDILVMFKTVFPYYSTPFTAAQIYSDIILQNKKIEYGVAQKFKEEKLEEKTELWMNRWSEICELGKEHNFKTIIFLQPILGTGEKQLSEYEEEFFHLIGGTHNVKLYDKYSEKIRDLSDKCTSAYDLRGVFDENAEPLYYDYVHINDKGNQIVADKIYELIKSEININ